MRIKKTIQDEIPPPKPKEGFFKRLWVKTRPAIARHRRNPMVKAVAKFSKVWLKAYENRTGNFARNGEKMLLLSLKGFGIKTIFDVGANYGQWELPGEQEL